MFLWSLVGGFWIFLFNFGCWSFFLFIVNFVFVEVYIIWSFFIYFRLCIFVIVGEVSGIFCVVFWMWNGILFRLCIFFLGCMGIEFLLCCFFSCIYVIESFRIVVCIFFGCLMIVVKVFCEVFGFENLWL